MKLFTLRRRALGWQVEATCFLARVIRSYCEGDVARQLEFWQRSGREAA